MRLLVYFTLMCSLFLFSCSDDRFYYLELGENHVSDYFYSLDVDYPVLMSSEKDDEVVSAFNKEIYDFLEVATEGFKTKESIDLMKKDVDESTSKARYSKQIEHELFYIYKGLYSIRFTIYDYALGAHGNSYYHSLNFSIEDNYRLQADDIIDRGSKEKLISLVELLNLFLEDPNNCFTLTAENLEQNIENINFTTNEILFSFAHYELGPYACGTVQIRIPLEQFVGRELLQPHFYELLTGTSLK